MLFPQFAIWLFEQKLYLSLLLWKEGWKGGDKGFLKKFSLFFLTVILFWKISEVQHFLLDLKTHFSFSNNVIATMVSFSAG